jgi:glycosyltransferase involved in cell wall biosynthesis
VTKEKILLFIPVYNCEKQIVRVISQLDSVILSIIDETVIVNNISTDKTEEVIINFLNQNPGIPAKLLRNDENYGLGGSHKTAFDYAIENNFDYVIVLHGDDQGNIKDMLPILKSGTYRNYDCCLGARFKKGSTLKGYSKFRTFGNIIYNIMFSIVSGRIIYDLGSGLNIYNVNMLKGKFYFRFPDDLTFNYCMILGTICFKHTFMFFPISWREDDQASNVKMVKQAFSVLGILLKYFAGKEKYLKSEFRKIPRLSYTSKIIFGAGKEERTLVN